MLSRKKWQFMFKIDQYRYFSFIPRSKEAQYIMKVDVDGSVVTVFKGIVGGMRVVSINIAKGLTFPKAF